MSLNDYTAVAVAWHDTPLMTADDLLSKEFLVGSNAPASDTTVWPLLLNALIGTPEMIALGQRYETPPPAERKSGGAR